ncbi:MAG: acyl-CoA transferase [Pseudomonadales bacterium]|nr:acyl-CoA transferase [Pseudomonadales bacterium]
MAPDQYFSAEIGRALGGGPLPEIQIRPTGALPSIYAVSALASQAIGSAAAEVSAWSTEALGVSQLGVVEVDGSRASHWFRRTIEPVGWRPPPIWDDLAGVYATRDGWIRLHTNAPHHRQAALATLACNGDKDAVASAVSRWNGEKLESGVVAKGGCAAVLRGAEQWREHENGAAVAKEAIIHRKDGAMGSTEVVKGTSARPLSGIKVLDLTRVLAGPVCTRFLAGWGAQVLRLDPDDWEEGAVTPEVALGKRCARIDLKREKEAFVNLLREADVLVHGYRSDALERLGFGESTRQEIRPGLIDVSLNAYGWTGSWSRRRGFDSLVQMSCGIADAGMTQTGREQPFPLPVQALDHATGYLMAAAVVRGLRERLQTNGGSIARTSLARTALLLMSGPVGDLNAKLPSSDENWSDYVESTDWGPMKRMRPPVSIPSAKMAWEMSAGPLGRHPPIW